MLPDIAFGFAQHTALNFSAGGGRFIALNNTVRLVPINFA